MLHGPFDNPTLGQYYYNDGDDTIRPLNQQPFPRPAHITLRDMGVYGPWHNPHFGGRYWYYEVDHQIVSENGQRRDLPPGMDRTKFTGQTQSSQQGDSSAQDGVAPQATGPTLNFAVYETFIALPPRQMAMNSAYQIIIAACKCAVDVLVSERGYNRACDHIRFWKKDPELLHPTHPGVTDLVDTFHKIIRRKSPVLAADERMKATPSALAQHPRRIWAGNPDEFDIRQQMILVNLHWVEFAVHCHERIKRGEQGAREAYILAFFYLLHALMHEYWHLFHTFLTNGRENTPGGISGGKRSRYTNENEKDGEGGEYMEVGLYGGIVQYRQDQHAHGNLTFNGESAGWPWLKCADLKTRRVTLQSMARLMYPTWTDPKNKEPFLQLDQGIPAIKTNQVARPPRVADINLGAPPGRNVLIERIVVVSSKLLTGSTA